MSSAQVKAPLPSVTALGRLILLVLLGQVALVALLGNWSSPGVHVVRTPSTPRLLWLPRAPEGTPALPGGAVLAEVSSAGFSGALWCGGDSARLSEPLAPTFVERMSGGAGPAPSFPDLAPETRTLATARAGARLQSWVALEAGSDADGPVRESRLRLGGGLAVLTVEVPVALPVWTNADILAPTRLQVLFEPGVGVLSATLLPGGSGVPAADQEALRLARQLRLSFRGPAAAADGNRLLVWGTADFVWHTVEPPAHP